MGAEFSKAKIQNQEQVNTPLKLFIHATSAMNDPDQSKFHKFSESFHCFFSISYALNIHLNTKLLKSDRKPNIIDECHQFTAETKRLILCA